MCPGAVIFIGLIVVGLITLVVVALRKNPNNANVGYGRWVTPDAPSTPPKTGIQLNKAGPAGPYNVSSRSSASQSSSTPSSPSNNDDSNLISTIATIAIVENLIDSSSPSQPSTWDAPSAPVDSSPTPDYSCSNTDFGNSGGSDPCGGGGSDTSW